MRHLPPAGDIIKLRAKEWNYMHRKRYPVDSWHEFQGLPLARKAGCYNDGERPFHTLLSQQFTRPMLKHLCDLATSIRRIAKTWAGMRFLASMLDDKRAMLYFTQPSSRTFLSFYAACQILGMKPAEVRDSKTSSEVKGETPEDSVRTFSSYFDLLVMRTPQNGFAEKMAWVFSHSERPVPIINAGSGSDQHPTQSLLDIYTLERSFENRGGIDGKTVVFVGDLARGRTVRSLSALLTKFDGVRQVFVAPDELQVGADILAQLDAAGVKYELTSDFQAAIPIADAIYMTRIQDEWDKTPGQSSKLKTENFRFLPEHLKILGEHSVIMHPLPRRLEIHPDVDHDPRAVYWRQVRNGMWIRAALMAWTFGRDEKVHNYTGG